MDLAIRSSSSSSSSAFFARFEAGVSTELLLLALLFEAMGAVGMRLGCHAKWLLFQLLDWNDRCQDMSLSFRCRSCVVLMRQHNNESSYNLGIGRETHTYSMDTTNSLVNVTTRNQEATG